MFQRTRNRSIKPTMRLCLIDITIQGAICRDIKEESQRLVDWFSQKGPRFVKMTILYEIYDLCEN